MNKKSKIIIVICTIVILVLLGAFIAYSLLNGKTKEKLEINDNDTSVIENETDNPNMEIEDLKDDELSNLTDKELEELF